MKLKCYSLVLFIIFSCTYVFSQPTVTLQRTIGGNDQDFLNQMSLTKDGGSILGGTSYSNKSGEKTDEDRGSVYNSDYWIVKLNSCGKIEWDKTIGGNKGDYLFALQQTGDGGYILGGSSESNVSGDKTQNSRGGVDYWIIKLTGSGKIQWDKTIGGNGTDYLYSLQQTRDGGYILGGWSTSNKSGEKTQNNRGGSDYWIVKLDDSGKIQWDKTIGGNRFDFLYSIQQTSEGGYILGGYSDSNISGEKTENSRGEDDYWVVKLDSYGHIQWDKTIGGEEEDHLFALRQTKDDGYILGGSSESDISGEKTQNNIKGSEDFWIVKLDNSGKIQWNKTIGGANSDELWSLQQTDDRGYILGGDSKSDISGQKTESSRGGFDYWIVKLDNYGKIQWDKTIGGGKDENLRSIKEIKEDHYVIAGSSYSGKSNDKTQANRGSNYCESDCTSDYWLVQLVYKRSGNREEIFSQNAITQNSLDDLKDSSNDTKLFLIYPNPTKDVLHIRTTGETSFSLINQIGKVLLTKEIKGNSIINVSTSPGGLYFIRNNATGEVKKVIIAK